MTTQEISMERKLAAGAEFPGMKVPKLGGGEFELGLPANGYDWQMVVVYRGKHCPLCARYLVQLQDLVGGFHELGVDVVALSADPEERAAINMADLGITLPVGYDLSIQQMRELGLYISNPRSPEETDRPFAEPGLFVINDAGRLQVTDISNGPFVRPDLQVLLNGLKFIRDPANNYPIRGTYS
jgi:peroxiredoxin